MMPYGQTAAPAPGVNSAQQGMGGLPALQNAAQGGLPVPYAQGAVAPPLTLHDVTVTRSKTFAQAKVEPVPPEEFGISRSARSLADSNYCFHKVISSVSKLLADGYDPAQVKTLPAYTAITNTEEITRDTVNESQYAPGDDMNEAARRIEVTEHYIRMDYDGNGKPCLYKVTTGGSQGDILKKKGGKEDIEEFDEFPFAAMTPVIMTHRFFGRSIADLVMDIQRIKTALLRGVLDNTYLRNNPRVEVAQSCAGPETIDDLLVARPGGIVRTLQPNGLNWQVIPDVTAASYQALQYMDATREWRTGVSRQGQGLDANALQNQSATAANQLYTAAQARMKLIAKIFAETGVRDLFSLLHATIRKHGEEAQTARLRGKWVTVNPRDWKTRNDMTIHVGLGTGGKTERLGHLSTIANTQKEMVLGGLTNIVTPSNLYNTAKEMTKLSGFQNPDKFFTDPTTQQAQPQQQKPDPEMIKLQMEQQTNQQKAQLEAEKSQADTQHQISKTQADQALAQQKFDLEKELTLLKADLQQREHQFGIAMKLLDQAKPGPNGEAPLINPQHIIEALRPQPAAHVPPRPMRVMRDAHGRVSHLEPVQ